MKRIFSIFTVCASVLLSGLAFSSCVDEMDDINEELVLGRCMTPTELVAKIVDGEKVEFDWSKSKGASSFVLELYTDEQMSVPACDPIVIPVAELPYLVDLEADMTYYARVKAVDDEKKIGDSNWADFSSKIETYAIKSSLDPELVDRTETSITIAWAKDPEVDHIRVTPALGEDEGFTKVTVSHESVANGQMEVKGLAPSVNYTLVLHFKSAERGTVTAWTRPAVDGATEVSTSEALIQAIADKAPVIKVAYSETPYVLGSVVLGGPVAIYGDAEAKGTQPVIQGGLKIGADVTKIHLEALTFDGLASADYPHNLTFDAKANVESITVRNCNLNNYLRGVLYENSKAPSIGSALYDNVVVNNVSGDGGDCFDFRGAAVISSIEFVNSTLNVGARTWFRIDASATLESIKLTHCTFNNLCFVNSGNNNGIFNIRAVNSEGASPAFTLTDNVFMNMNDENNRGCLIAKNSTSAFPSEIRNNFFYNCYDRFFIAQQDGSKLSGDAFAAAVVEGKADILGDHSVELAADPCVDSARDKFNVTSKEVITANAGDPRWYAAYVEIPEDLTQTVTPAGKEWNLTDAQTFKKLADKDMVRDGIRFYVKNTPVNFEKTGFVFSGEAAIGSDGVPTDGAIGIKVNEPGSIVISVAAASGHSNLTVSLDDKISAAVPAGAEYQKVTFADIDKESMIYIYGCHPATMTFLQWTSDIQVLDKVLATPVVKISKTTVNERAEDEITLTWDAIDYAGSYNVTVDGKVKNVTDLSYTFSTEGYAVEEAGGDFAIEVTAVPAADDYTREESVAAELSFHVNDVPIVDTGEIVDPSAITETYFAELNDAGGFAAQKFADGTGAVTVGKLTFGDKAELDGNRYKHGGASVLGEDGIPTNRYVSFKITRAGTISHKVISGSSSATDRAYAVALVTNIAGSKNVKVLYQEYSPTSSDADPVTTEVTEEMLAGITEAAVVYVYTLANCNTYAVGYDPVPADPAKVDRVWDFSSSAWVDAMTGSGIAANTNDSNWNLEVDGLKVVSGGGSIKWNVSGETYFWQPGGKSDGTTRYFEFTTDVAGKLSVWASNTGSSEDLTRMVTVKVGDADPESLPGGYSSSDDPRPVDFNIGKGVVKIYPTGNGLRFYKIEFHSN